MSNFRFGADDYKLSYYPPEASDGIGGVDWDKVESVEIEFDVYVKERTCRIEWRDDSHDTDAGYERDGAYFCTACGADLLYPLQECWDDYQAGNYEKPFNYCPSCGCKVVDE